ncbi:hypothetical protein F4805DRAFT_435782 [Annulohypoxylon moriforme]|nr:hypothetical protein F4805DRAFT_435782 [Annulohypoxylon moriforme]
MATLSYKRDAMERDCHVLRLEVEVARRKINPSHHFDAKYWAEAAEVCEILVRLHEAKMNLAEQEWKEEEEDDDTEMWWTTSHAHRIIDRVKASRYEREYCQKQALLNTSRTSLDIGIAGAGKLTESEQSKFEQSLIHFYNAAVPSIKSKVFNNIVYDSATGQNQRKHVVTAAQLVPHSLGEDTLVALFGTNVEGELDAPYNGLLLDTAVKEAMDDGAIAIVPLTEDLAIWENMEPKEFKWRIMDPEAEILDRIIRLATETLPELSIRDLDGQKLAFKNDMRPKTEYVYFTFAIAQLRLAWRHEYRKGPNPNEELPKQLGKGCWVAKTRYLQRPFLLALAKEIGRNTGLTDDIIEAPGEDEDVDETGIFGIAKWLQSYRWGDEDELDSDDEAEGTW